MPAYTSCPHGIVSGQCNACLADLLAKEAEEIADMRDRFQHGMMTTEEVQEALSMRRAWQSCSWCRRMNRVTERWCSNCGHAAQTPRVQCDCAQCQP
jgi:hypothetical protein